MGGTITREEWLKLQEGERERSMVPRGPGNIVIPLALQMKKALSANDASPPQPDQSKNSLNLEA